MKTKSYSIPFGMVFKKYHCSQCGAKLEKERTHRVVTKDDKDYYQYHDYGEFPRRDVDVYDYRFKCPSCGARIAFDEQCIIERIQKKCGQTVLSSFDVKEHYKECKEGNSKRVLYRNIGIPIATSLLAGLFYYLFSGDRTPQNLTKAFVLLAIIAVCSAIAVVRRYKGNYKIRSKRTYSYEKESQLNRLHAYSSHNKKLIDTADKCYCFYCKSCIGRDEIKTFIDNGQTALCPKCDIDAIIPDNLGETVDEEIISEMNEYWF